MTRVVSKRLKTPESRVSESGNEPANSLAQQQKETMDSAFNNPLIIQQIARHVPFIPLKVCRLVNSTWNQLSSESLQKSSKIRLKCISFENYQHPQHSHLTLAQLLTSMTKSRIPCSHFSISGVSDMNDDALFFFFQDHGHSIKTLDLSLNHHDLHNGTTPSAMRTINKKILWFALNRKLPNLEIFRFQNRQSYYRTFLKCSLPALKSFSWLNGDPVVHKIIEGAPNLKRIPQTVSSTTDLDVIARCGKIHVLNEVTIDLARISPDLISAFQKGRPKLRKLGFTSDSQENNLLALSMGLMEESKDHLEEFGPSMICAGSDQVQIPRMKKLKILQLGTFLPVRSLPHGINFNETFPNLKVLDCSLLICMIDKTWDNYLPGEEPFRGNLPTVEKLVVYAKVTEEWMKILHRLCPNFKSLFTAGGDQAAGIVFPRIFRVWSHLESLKWIMGNMILPIQNLDSYLTGLSGDTCDRLRSGETIDNVEELRVQPSLYDLQNLKELHIVLNLCSESLNFPLPITRVAGIYGFQRVPGLKVDIEVVTQRKALNPVVLAAVKKELGPYAHVHGPSSEEF